VTSDLYVSTGAFTASSLGEILRTCRDHGIDRVELSSGLQHAPDFLAPVHATPELAYLVHNYFPPPAEPFVLNLASTDSSTLARSHAMAREAIDLAAQLGAPFYSVHSGFALNLTPALLGNPAGQAAAAAHQHVSRDDAYAIFLRSVSQLADHARSRSIRLLVENNVLSPIYLAKHGANPLLLCDADEILRFFRDLSDDSVGLLLDVGHAKVSATALGFAPADFLIRVAPHIGAWHLSDNDGIADQNRPLDETAWFFPHLREHAPVPIVLEIYRLTPGQLREQLALVQGALTPK